MRITRRIQAVLFFVILFGLGVLLPAATINVTTTADNVAGSLREAITTANVNGEDDIIYLGVGTYTLTGASGEDANVSGDLDINNPDSITIIGVHSFDSIISGNQVDRVLDIHSGTVYLESLSVIGGLPGYGENGGGIYNRGDLTMTLCSLSSNGTRGGEYEDTEGGNGGGIYNVSGGTASFIACGIGSNSTGDGYDADGVGALGGPAGQGGGIYNNGTMSFVRCRVSGNSTGDMGAYCNFDYARGNGGGIFNNGTMTMSRSAIYNNTCGDGDLSNTVNDANEGGSGGGIFNTGTATITNSTISGNLAGDGGDAADGYGGDGGGVYNAGTMTLSSCTVADNTTGQCTDTVQYPGLGGDGGGVYDESGLGLGNTIVAGNFAADGGEGADAYGAITSLGYNLLENAGGFTLSGTLTGNITGQDPLLQPFSYNVNLMPIHEIRIDSPAVDAGSSFGETVDQWGNTRPTDMPAIANAGDGSDIGAFELDITYNITGDITYEGNGLEGVTLTFEGAGTYVTGTGGFYTYAVLHGWSGTVTPAKSGYAFDPVNRTYTNVTTYLYDQDFTATVTGNSEIALSRTQINFGATTAGSQTGAQRVYLSNTGAGTLVWTATGDQTWLSCTPASGAGGAELSIAVDPSGLSPGAYTGSVSIADPNAGNTPQAVAVTLNVYSAASPSLPFGNFDSPLDGAVVTGSIAVTGWAVDNVGIAEVKIYRDPVSGEGSGLVYIGDATMVENARTDIEAEYPTYPDNHKAGWGYMMLTNFMPNQGNGTFVLYAVAVDIEGNSVSLGTKTITGDNANGINPFGAIDTPAQGGTISGGDYVNFGWALTPLPNTIPKDGSTITVWVDGESLGNPEYDHYREDVEAFFPGLNNSAGAIGFLYINTTNYDNGRHYIYWIVTDDAGNADGIGSRYFNVRNAGARQARSRAHIQRAKEETAPPVCLSPLRAAVGFDPNGGTADIFPDSSGRFQLQMNALGRVEIHLEPNCSGYMAVGEKRYPLPVGSRLDREKGVFYWNAGPGFTGTYDLVFHIPGESGLKKKNVRILVK